MPARRASPAPPQRTREQPPRSGTYYLSSPVNQWRVLSVPNWGVDNGDPLQVLGCGCGAHQQWVFTYVINFSGSLKKAPFRPPAG